MFTLGGMLLLLAKGSGEPAVEAIVLVASLVLATVAIGLGPGSVPYTLMGELFPPEYRTLGSCVVLVVRSFFQHLSSNILLESTPSKQERLSVSAGEVAPLSHQLPWPARRLHIPRVRF